MSACHLLVTHASEPGGGGRGQELGGVEVALEEGTGARASVVV